VQLSIRHSGRNYDPSIAGLGTGKVQRYVASDFDRLSDRLFDACKIAVLEVVACSNAVLHVPSQYSNAVPDRGNIAVDEIDEEARIASTG
jgi:hypothetical protein